MSLAWAEELRAYPREEATDAGLRAALDAAGALVGRLPGGALLPCAPRVEVSHVPRTKPVLEVFLGPMTALSQGRGREAPDLFPGAPGPLGHCLPPRLSSRAPRRAWTTGPGGMRPACPRERAPPS